MQEKPRKMKPIPTEAAERIAKDYGYDQVVILARRVGEDPQPCGEHITTYGINKEHCRAAGMMGDTLKRIARWPTHSPRWLNELFNVWLPRRQPDDSWVVVMERRGQPPICFIDLSDEAAGYEMHEDEAIDKARHLNALNWQGDEDTYVNWMTRPL